MRVLATKFLVKAFASLPGFWLSSLELVVQMSQGKGWGHGSINAESENLALLIKRLGLIHPTVLDVGANSGSYTLALKKKLPEVTIHAFEPSHTAFNSLLEKLGDIEGVHCHNLGFGKESGKFKLYSNSPGTVFGSLSKRKLHHWQIDFSYNEEVEIWTLDSWLLKKNFRPEVLKMDVEGSELNVLLGASETLKDIRIIQFEFGPCNVDSRTYFQDFWYLFTENGFTIYRLGPNGLERIEAYTYLHETFNVTNYYAVRQAE